MAAMPSGFAQPEASAPCECGGTCGGCGGGDGHDHGTAPSGMVTAQFFPEARARKVGPCGPRSKRHVVLGNGGVYQPAPPNLQSAPSDGSVTFVPMIGQRPTKRPRTAMGSLPLPEMPSDNGGMGFVPTMKRPGQPKAPTAQMPSDGGGMVMQPRPTPVQPDPEKPAVVVVRTPQGDVPVILNPSRPWCQDPRIDAELCGAAQVSDFCGKAFSAWLAANPGVDARAFLSTGDGELCAQEIAGVIRAADAKASAGMYRASGALPNYHFNRGAFRPSGLGLVDPGEGGTYGGASSWTHGGAADLGSGGYIATASDWTMAPNPVAPPQPVSPPVDYGRLIAGIGSAVGGVFQGINTAIANGQQNRLRELELEFARDARAGQLALQRLEIENRAAIQQLAATGTPAATEAANALQQQNMALQMQLQQLNADPPMSTAAKVGLGLLAVAIVGGGAYALIR